MKLAKIVGDNLGSSYLVACTNIVRNSQRANSETAVGGHF